MNAASHIKQQPNLETVKQLRRYQLHAIDGGLGRVDDFYIDDLQWRIRYLVANTGAWLLGRKVLLSPESLDRPDPEARVIPVRLTKEQIENSPPVEADKPVSKQVESMLAKYFGWYPWSPGGSLIPMGPTPLAAPPLPDIPESRTPAETEGPNLRSTNEITGYAIQAKDDEIGHIEDVIIEPENWMVRYIAVDTRKFWPGRRVLIAPDWIGFIRWADQKVTVNLRKSDIETSPEYDASRPITRDYEAALHQHFRRTPYWEE